MTSLQEHKNQLIEAMNSNDCVTLNQFIALLEMKKYEIVTQLFKEHN